MDNQEQMGGTPIPQEGDPRLVWYCPKPTIRILFYVDDPAMNLSPWYERRDHRGGRLSVTENEFGLYIMRDLLMNEGSELADFEISLLDRHQGGQAANRLVPDLLAGYDEVWFFGRRQMNTPTEPDNELTDPEIAALLEWMNSGGMLMTGDHANPQPRVGGVYVDPTLDHLLGLGRAIGHRVPRAGALRRWEGSPAIDEQVFDGEQTYIYNTQVPVGTTDPKDLALQEDEWPQKLILTTYALPSSGPLHSSQTLGRQVHRLFCGDAAPISVFPDHMHEGALVMPQTFPTEVWPSGPSGQPLPEVVARGTDVNGEVRDLVMVYDGTPAGVGRIVADSTWHHYFNVNLIGFPADGNVSSQLSQYYVNLAVWLAPLAKRQAMAWWQRWQLANNATVQMSYGNPIAVIGRTATGVLRRTLGPCIVGDLVDTMEFASMSAQDGLKPPPELLVGGVINAYLEAFEQARTDDRAQEEGIDALTARGLRAAYDEFAVSLRNAAEGAERARELLEERLRTGA